jgi:short-chain fatty acids transporter
MKNGLQERFAGWASSVASLMEKYFPEAFIFALLATAFVFVVALALGQPVSAVCNNWGKGFWSLLAFTLQMAMIIITGFVLAASPPIYRVIQKLAAWPRTPRQAVCWVALFSLLTSLINWGFSLIFSGLLAKEVAHRVKGTDFRAVGAASYLGLGGIWAQGLSSSAALLMATPGAIPGPLLKISGVIPLTQTLFIWQNYVAIVALVVVTLIVAYFYTPPPEKAKTMEKLGVSYEPLDSLVPRVARPTPGEWLEHRPILILFFFALSATYLVTTLRTGGLAALDLNVVNLIFLSLGMLLHWTPASFLKAVSKSTPATAGVLLQFPFYAGIFGMIVYAPEGHSSISDVLARLFVKGTTPGTFPLLVSIYSAVLGLFVPSGGAKWLIEAPYVLEAAKLHGVHMGWTVNIYNIAEALPNLINPFWMLPILGLLNVRARDLIGYSLIMFLFHFPLVLLLCSVLARTF